VPWEGCTESNCFDFNGKENDREEWGSQLIQDYGFRLYNPAIAKFLSFDPLAPEYPELTPYQFASNRPIRGIDLDGLEFADKIIGISGGGGTTKVETTNSSKVNLAVLETTWWAIRNSNAEISPSSAYKLGITRALNPTPSAAAHAINLYGEGSNSSWLSASTRLPFGSKFHNGHSYWINIGEAKKTGTTYIGARALMKQVNRHAKQFDPNTQTGESTLNRIQTWRSRQTWLGGEKEVLFGKYIEPSALDSKGTVGLKMAGKGLMVYGLYNTGTALYGAYEEGGGISSTPFKNETIRQTSSWGSAWAAGSAAAAYTAGSTSITGPWAVAFGLGAGLVGGTAGYFFGDEYVKWRDSQPAETE